MLEGFATIYRDNSNLIRIYFYPGYDKYGRHIMKFDMTSIDYKFVRYEDKAIEYTLLNSKISNIEYSLTNNFTKEKKTYNINCKLL